MQDLEFVKGALFQDGIQSLFGNLVITLKNNLTSLVVNQVVCQILAYQLIPRHWQRLNASICDFSKPQLTELFPFFDQDVFWVLRVCHIEWKPLAFQKLDVDSSPKLAIRIDLYRFNIIETSQNILG
ncbi:MAG: hypothetical protein BWX66_02056 [Deltaproteobacteria bacterium ADurb.Bin058]|nr:MAG: hypothetical protein BWX66_02056 [Deltaproteobacteria bacterium ADurb.Bin058]